MTLLRRLITIALFVALLVGGWMFRAANEASIELNYVVGSVPGLPLWLALGGAFALGALSVALPLLYRLARSGMLARRYRRAMTRLESEVHELRTLPLAADAANRGVPSADDGTLRRTARGG